MKKTLTVFALWAMAVFALVSLSPAGVDTLTILHTNDTHAHLLPYGPKDAEGNWMWGGMAKIATMAGMTRMGGGKVMLMDAGDFSVGDFMFQKYLSIAELQIMKALGYDAIALGNHEFDLFPSTLKYELNEAGLPDGNTAVLCANLDLTGDQELGLFVKPYIIKQMGELKIGIFSLLNEVATQISNPSPVVVRPALAEAQAWVDSLEAQQCDLIVLLSHLGFDYDQMVASQVTGIDVIVGGHSHTMVTSPVTIGNTVIVQAGEFGRYLGKLTIIFDNKLISDWAYDLISIDETVPAEPTVAALVGNLAAGVESDARFGPVYTEDIAEAAVDLNKPLGAGLFRDNALGNLVADAIRAKTGTDISFQPQGFCSQTIYEGYVRGADIFQAVPYGYDTASGFGLKLATFETDGMSIISGLEFAVYNLPYVEDFFLHGSNISYAYNSANPPGARVDYGSIMIGGYPLDPMATYTVTVCDAVIGFLSQIPGFNTDDIVITGDFVYTVTRDFMVANSPVAYYTEGRVIDLAPLANPLAGVAAIMETVNQFEGNGSIDNRGTANSMLSQLAAVEKALTEGRIKTALNVLKAFESHLEAQSGKHIAAESADRLMYLTGELREAIHAASLPAAFVDKQIDLRLGQNSPNPFNPATRIGFTLSQANQARLEIYNILGQRVKVLLDEYLEPGSHSAVWNGTDDDGNAVAGGVYLYRVTAGDQTSTRKMILMK